MDESKISDELLAMIGQDLFGGGRSAWADELEEYERSEAARRRKRIVIGSVVGLLGAIAVIAVAWWLFA
jgi:hypothetical protein